jgi:hypothetical protein
MLHSFFYYFGAKMKLSKYLPKPKHNKIIEVFAGSAGYSLHYPQCKVILIDIDPVIYGVWDYLIHVKSAEIFSLPNMEVGQSTDDLKICQEAKWLIGFWLDKGSAAPRKLYTQRHLKFGNLGEGAWGDKIKERIVRQIPFIRHWQIKRGSYNNFNLSGKATWIVDPPYEKAGKEYTYNKIVYQQLAQWVKERQGLTIVHEQLGAKWLPFKFLKEIKCKCTVQDSNRRSAEVVYIQETK